MVYVLTIQGLATAALKYVHQATWGKLYFDITASYEIIYMLLNHLSIPKDEDQQILRFLGGFSSVLSFQLSFR